MENLYHQEVDQNAKSWGSSQFLPGHHEASRSQAGSLRHSPQAPKKGVLVPRGTIKTKRGIKSVGFTDSEVIYCFTTDGRPVGNSREGIKFSQQEGTEQQKEEGLQEHELKGPLLQFESQDNDYDRSRMIPFSREEDYFSQMPQQTFGQESSLNINLNFQNLQEPQFTSAIQLHVSRACQNYSEDEDDTVTKEDSPRSPNLTPQDSKTLQTTADLYQLAGPGRNTECNEYQHQWRTYQDYSCLQTTGLTNQSGNETYISDHNLNLTNMAQNLAQQQSRQIRTSLFWTKRKLAYASQPEPIQ